MGSSRANATLTDPWLRADRPQKIYRASAGIRWREIVRHLESTDLSVKVMQSNSDFGVGSTFCVNAHGWPVPHGPFGSTVKAIRLVLADGTLMQCSRTENAELFGLAMGGYGLFGVIVELDVEMTENLLLQPKFERMAPERFASEFTRVIDTDSFFASLAIAARTDAIVPIPMHIFELIDRSRFTTLNFGGRLKLESYGLLKLRDRPLSPAATIVFEAMNRCRLSSTAAAATGTTGTPA